MMPPPQTEFLASELPIRVHITTENKKRKHKVDLNDCALKQITQYSCEIEYQGPKDRKGEIVCRPIVRLFRQ